MADHLVENEVVESSINSATIVAIVIGVLFGVALITCGFVCFNTKGNSSNVQSNDKNKSNRGSGYFPVDNGFGGSKSQRGSAYFTPEKHVKPFASEPVVMRQNSGRRVRNTEMTTFGKDRVQGKEKSPRDSDIEHSVKKYLDSVHYDSSPVVVSSSTQPQPVVATLEAALTNSFSSSHTDDLSTLGVPVDSRDEVDCLGGVLEQLEPSLEVKRRSRNFDRENRRSILRLSLPPGTEVSLTTPPGPAPALVTGLTGPTGYPVMVPSPGSMVMASSPTSKIQYHLPSYRASRD